MGLTIAAALFATATMAQVSCQRYGNQTSCTNGQIFHHYGSQTIDNLGNTWQHYDHQTDGCNGTRYTHYGNQTITTAITGNTMEM